VVWYKYKIWLWPVLVSAIVLIAFAIPGSDLPAQAVTLVFFFAVLTALAFILPAPECPALVQRKSIRHLLIALAIFFTTFVISAFLAAYDPSAAWLAAIKMGGVICAFALGLRCSLTDEQAKKLFEALLYVGGVWAGASILMFILDPDGIYGFEKFGAGRLTGAFSSPNSAGTLFGAMSVMALGRLISRVRSRRESQILERIDPAMAGIWIVSLAALMLTVSRGAIFSTLIGSAVLCVMLLRNYLPLPKLAAGVAAIVIVLTLVFAAPLISVIGRLGGIDNDAAVRATILKSHFTFAMQHPWFGAGPGSFNTINNHIVTAADYSALAVIRAAHNVYLQWFEETGGVGLLSLAILNLAILWPMISGARHRHQMSGRIWAILAGYLVFLLHGFTDYAFQEPALAMFMALLMGCGFAMAGNRSTTHPHRSVV
jgi:O-antigen ligase